ARVNEPLPQCRHGDERVRRAVETDWRHRPDVCDREGIPNILERPWVSGLTVPAAKYRLIVQAECKTDARQEQPRTRLGAAVKWYAAQASSEDLPRFRVEQVDAGVIFPRNWKALPAQSVGQRQAAANLPVIARVKSVLLPINRVRVAKLVDLARGGRESQQEIRPAMKLLALSDAACVTLQACGVAAESERASHRLECPALRLEV